MADKSGIEWTEATWNPIVGCTHVSPGCDNCYAAREASGRLKHLPLYAGLATAGKFTGEVRLVPERLGQPLRWRKPRRVFVNSMSDLFHETVPDEFIAQVFAVMAFAPQHSFQVLTKRHGRLQSLLNNRTWWTKAFARACADLNMPTARTSWMWDINTGPAYALRNVWLIVSVENQQWAGIRIPALRNTPAAVRGLSCEPLLGPLHDLDLTGISWVICGGESGPGARPMHPDWARGLRDQCVAAGVPFFLKQWGEWCYSDQMPEDTWTRLDSAINLGQQPHPEPHRVGKQAAGRELDGRTWDEYPHVAEAVPS